MPRELTTTEIAQVEGKRKATKPKVFDPNSTNATEISGNFEAFLILANRSVKQKTITQVKSLLDAEADSDFQDLFRVASEHEADSLAEEMGDLDQPISDFNDWRSDPGISGWQDVAEVGWMVQELQQGLDPIGEKEDLLHYDRLRTAALQRLLTSTKSAARRDVRLKALLAALNAY